MHSKYTVKQLGNGHYEARCECGEHLTALLVRTSLITLSEIHDAAQEEYAKHLRLIAAQATPIGRAA